VTTACGQRAGPGLDFGICLQECPYLTTSSCWNVEELPSSLAILGAGHAAVEIAQAFARFGSAVTIFARSRWTFLLSSEV